MMDNQYANIFSTYATVYGSHSAMFAFYWKREYFFFMCILNLVFFLKTWFVSFYLSPKLFFPKLVLFFLFLLGEKFFSPLWFLEGVVALHRGSYLYFLLLYCICFLSTFWLGSLCQYVTKRGRHRWPVCFV